ncbi:MAG: ABC transporter ATP-binding protein [Lachnospiraceae bacterium]|nr:ABC transporter ATP-binding protein [Lachnospiraceae bacterium]
MQNALELKGVSKQYRGFALSDVNFTLPSGCIMGFIGENGAGKTTTIKLILDMIRRDGGHIEIFGEDCRTMKRDAWESIGVVLDSCGFSEELTAVHVGKIMAGIYKSWKKEEFERLLNNYHVDQNKKVKEYSKGMKMKLSLAVAMAHETRLLILDEATSGLDPVAREELLESFQEFIQDERRSILISSHIISDLEKISDYITFIHRGNILFSEEKDMLLENHGIFHGTKKALMELPEDAVAGIREGAFGVEALVKRDRVARGMALDRAGLEDIMLFYSREEKR